MQNSKEQGYCTVWCNTLFICGELNVTCFIKKKQIESHVLFQDVIMRKCEFLGGACHLMLIFFSYEKNKSIRSFE